MVVSTDSTCKFGREVINNNTSLVKKVKVSPKNVRNEKAARLGAKKQLTKLRGSAPAPAALCAELEECEKSFEIVCAEASSLKE